MIILFGTGMGFGPALIVFLVMNTDLLPVLIDSCYGAYHHMALLPAYFIEAAVEAVEGSALATPPLLVLMALAVLGIGVILAPAIVRLFVRGVDAVTSVAREVALVIARDMNIRVGGEFGFEIGREDPFRGPRGGAIPHAQRVAAVTASLESMPTEEYKNPEALSALGSRELKEVLSNRGKDISGILEKSELLGMLGDQSSCVVCLEDYAPGVTVLVLPCHHHFHPKVCYSARPLRSYSWQVCPGANPSTFFFSAL